MHQTLVEEKRVNRDTVLMRNSTSCQLLASSDDDEQHHETRHHLPAGNIDNDTGTGTGTAAPAPTLTPKTSSSASLFTKPFQRTPALAFCSARQEVTSTSATAATAAATVTSSSTPNNFILIKDWPPDLVDRPNLKRFTGCRGAPYSRNGPGGGG